MGVVMDFMYYGDILVVDLEAGTTEEVEIDEAWEAGPVLPAALELFDKHAQDDPLLFGSGILTGTTAPASCLGFALGASPITGGPAVAPLNLFAGAEMKLSGFSMVLIKGNSPGPVYLWLHDGVADLVDASRITGKDTWQTCDAVRDEMGEQLIQVISIGPVGEAKSDLASFSINYWGSGDNAALGALMGAKNLKAVALRGLGMIDAEDPEEFYNRTMGLLPGLPSEKSFDWAFEGLGEGGLDAWLGPLVHRYRSCFACPCACNTFVKYNEDPAVMGSDGVQEPGLMVTNPAAALWLGQGGWSPEGASRAMEAMARAGVDVVRGSREISAEPLEAPGEIAAAVEALTGPAEAAWPPGEGPAEGGIFGPWTPPSSSGDRWLEVNRAAYVLGVCPLFLAASGVEREDLLELCVPAAGIKLDAGGIKEMFDRARA
ncbi:MAG: hypothetical protein KKH73_03200 [Actinobacteria bacterium]|nr:hypothetical protein [Actinomycetota bacterium]